MSKATPLKLSSEYLVAQTFVANWLAIFTFVIEVIYPSVHILRVDEKGITEPTSSSTEFLSRCWVCTNGVGIVVPLRWCTQSCDDRMTFAGVSPSLIHDFLKY